jgi:hypothetical protein
MAALGTRPELAISQVISDIEGAWKRHDAAVQSIRYECAVKYTEQIDKNSSGDPFGKLSRGAKEESIELKGNITFSVAGDRLAFHREAEHWDYKAKKPALYTYRSCFDGQQNQELIPGVATVGRIETAKEPVDSLTKARELLPLWLAYSPPRFLKNSSYIAWDRARLIRSEVFCGDEKCIEISIPSKQGIEAPTHSIYVAAKADYRPMRYTSFYKGVLRREIILNYDQNEKISRKLTTWSTSYYTDKGRLVSRVDGVVRRCQLNPALDKTAFAIEFPVGTNVMKDGIDFIQEERGKLKPAKPQGGTARPDTEL